MTQIETITSVVKTVIKQQLAPAHIVDVWVEEDLDHDGDQILRISIVFEIAGDRLDPQKVVSLARHLRKPLEKIHEDRYPIFTFAIPGELDGAAA